MTDRDLRSGRIRYRRIAVDVFATAFAALLRPGDLATHRNPWMTPEERARTIAYLDLEEARGPVPVLADEGIRDVLERALRIAVIGASPDPARPSHDVFRQLLGRGFDCVPINPNADAVLGVHAYPTLGAAVDATGRVDIVDVFRRSELCVPHAEEAVATGAACLWLQLGVVNWEAATIAHEGGLSVVMDRCTAIELRRLRVRRR